MQPGAHAFMSSEKAKWAALSQSCLSALEHRAPGGGGEPMADWTIWLLTQAWVCVPQIKAADTARAAGHVLPTFCPSLVWVNGSFGSPRSGHGAHPEREFCGPNLKAYAAGCGWIV
eukprot:6603830-Prymnesium_polylepis.1